METLSERLLRKKQEIQNAAPRLVQGMAAEGLALVRMRIERDGLPGKNYSANFVPTFLFASQTLNAAGKAYIKQNRLGNWGGLRAAQGLPSDRVTLAYTVRMWNSLSAALAGGTGTIYQAKVVSADKEGAEKVKHNKARYGDFLQPNERETKLVAASADKEIQRILQAP